MYLDVELNVIVKMECHRRHYHDHCCHRQGDRMGDDLAVDNVVAAAVVVVLKMIFCNHRQHLDKLMDLHGPYSQCVSTTTRS